MFVLGGLLLISFLLLTHAAMAASKVDISHTVNGQVYKRSYSTSYDVGTIAEKTILPAKTGGTLTTRTNATTGSLTLLTGHGVTTAALFDLYWTLAGVEYSRLAVVAGTVSGNVVPISGGTGDDLPAAATSNLRTMIPVEENFSINGSNAKCIEGFSQVCGGVTLMNATPAVITSFSLEVDPSTPANGGVYLWTAGDGTVNPLDTTTPVKVRLSHGDPVNSQLVRFFVGVD